MFVLCMSLFENLRSALFPQLFVCLTGLCDMYDVYKGVVIPKF